MKSQSLRSAIDGKCRDCGACDAGANWREHVSCCPVIDCPLWQVRPLSRYAPDWLASREADALPDGWCKLPMEQALAAMRNAPARTPRDSEKLSCGAKPVGARAMGARSASAPASGPVTATKGGVSC